MMYTHAWFDINLLKLRENITNIEFKLNKDELYQEDQLPHDFKTEEMINEKGHHLVEIQLEDAGQGMAEVVAMKFADRNMENIETLLNSSEVDEKRKRRSKNPIGKASHNIYLIRAMDGVTDTFKPMDYVMEAGKIPISKEDIKQVMEYFGEERIPVKRPGARNLLWVAEHAQNNAVVYGKPFIVGMIKTDASKVYEASNPGELLYDGEIKASTVLLGFDENGEFIQEDYKYAREMSY